MLIICLTFLALLNRLKPANIYVLEAPPLPVCRQDGVRVRALSFSLNVSVNALHTSCSTHPWLPRLPNTLNFVTISMLATSCYSYEFETHFTSPANFCQQTDIGS